MDNFASSTVAEHLLRGAIAFAAIAVTLSLATIGWSWWTVPAMVSLGVGAMVALRGCPMCWTIGLVQTIRMRFSPRPRR